LSDKGWLERERGERGRGRLCKREKEEEGGERERTGGERDLVRERDSERKRERKNKREREGK
jgi:hypothetical protein